MDTTHRTVIRLKFPDRIPALNPDPRHFPNELNYVAFSPNGAHLALNAEMPKAGNPKIALNTLYTLTIAGSEAKRIHQIEAPPKGKSDSLLPAWSPDSKRIAIQVLREKSAELYLCNPDGTAKTRLNLPGIIP
jgi:Tol biopolymer transport system component